MLSFDNRPASDTRSTTSRSIDPARRIIRKLWRRPLLLLHYFRYFLAEFAIACTRAGLLNRYRCFFVVNCQLKIRRKKRMKRSFYTLSPVSWRFYGLPPFRKVKKEKKDQFRKLTSRVCLLCFACSHTHTRVKEWTFLKSHFLSRAFVMRFGCTISEFWASVYFAERSNRTHL